MKSLSVFLFVALALAVVPVTLAAPLGTNELAAARTQGSNSLATFEGLITPSNFQLMGFNAVAEVGTATNGEPLLIYTVQLTQLAGYQPPNNFGLLVHPDPRVEPAPVTRVIVPILVGTNVRSSMTLRLVSAAPGQPVRWTNANWGYSGLIKDLIGTYRTIPQNQLKSGWSPFAVEIPVFDIWLIGYYTPQNDLRFRATSDMRVGAVAINRNQDISEAHMHQMAIIAQRYNGLPN